MDYSSGKKKSGELWECEIALLARTIADVIRREELNRAEPALLAAEVVRGITVVLGGGRLYLPPFIGTIMADTERLDRAGIPADPSGAMEELQAMAKRAAGRAELKRLNIDDIRPFTARIMRNAMAVIEEACK